MAKSWRIKDADPYFYRLGVKRATHGMPFVDDKNPATAFTFSLLFCGAGQSYSGQRMKAVLFQALMLLFLTGASKKGETARIWTFVLPFALIPVLGYMEKSGMGRAERITLLTVVFIQAVIIHLFETWLW